MSSRFVDPSLPPAAVLIADCGRRILHVAGGAFEEHGLSTQGLIGQTIECVVPESAVPFDPGTP